ncbi:hypothetical protein A3K86_04790 [Photobacterium jeanii]|uniref:PEP-CTERM protein-sorting domain-containing protein n=1 Tax=Photobacterium jeanii TaxID=858640 RepID=A0A178KLR9_9GAMM|nr:THxN family PEP-CTERM protein [Photobacterium jeanii]OAN18217.1 hypothetical protein A3K86_04790 [Photobacterium jeanii]PST92106.1 hypothetical protein C9I91_02685 [Photobacterium jeanii]
MKTKLLMASLALATAFNAQAVPVSFGAFTAEWFDFTSRPGANPPVATDNATGAPKLRWGSAATSSGQSGYNFVTESAFMTNFDPMVGSSPDFDLGTFTHLNNPIFSSGSALLTTKLKISTTVQVDTLPVENVEFIFDFTHEETPNSANPCAYGTGVTGDVGSINEFGCADRVTVTTNEFTDVFSIDNVDYTVNIKGFTVGGNFVNAFLTKEKADNDATIIANISAFVNPNEVPEPTPFAILGAGLLGLGAVRRMKKNKAKS